MALRVFRVFHGRNEWEEWELDALSKTYPRLGTAAPESVKTTLAPEKANA